MQCERLNPEVCNRIKCTGSTLHTKRVMQLVITYVMVTSLIFNSVSALSYFANAVTV